MNSMPFSIFRIIQGFSYPHKSKIFIVGTWDTQDLEGIHTISSILETDTHIVLISDDDDNLDLYLEKFKNTDYMFHLIIHSRTSKSLDNYLTEGSTSTIINSKSGNICVLVNELGRKSFLSDRINAKVVVNIEDPLYFLPNFVPENWSQKNTTVIFEAPEAKIRFTVPDTFSLKRTSPDLLWAVESVILSPWHDKYQKEWVPTRRPGSIPGLSFSGGVDSTAAMCLMPESSILFYMERDFESMIDHTNAKRFISHLRQSGREIIISKSNHEILRTFHSKNYGFSTDYACMAHMILLADHYDLDSAATGMPLENSYFFHGSKVREFDKSTFWKRYSPMFEFLGIPLNQPVAGCSEILNLKIVKDQGYEDFAKSCIRSNISGETCNECWKCFRKNIFSHLPWKMSPEISKFLKKRPLKQGIATLYALQMISKSKENLPIQADDLSEILDEDLAFLLEYWPPSVKLLPPKYQQQTQEKLEMHASQMKINLYELNPKIGVVLRGEKE
jgi:hypothetical protein